MTTVVSPGQGVQRRGMGRDLFGKYRPYIHLADEILGYSTEKLCVDDPERKFDLTHYTQPALYVVNAMIHYNCDGEVTGDAGYYLDNSLGGVHRSACGRRFCFFYGRGDTS